MIRDEEIKRLIKYAEGLNTKVIFSNKDSNSYAEWYTDGLEIIIYIKNRTSKIMQVLSLIHEIAHHLEFIHNHERVMNQKLNEAIGSKKKRHRKMVYEFERNSADWWETIYKETDCKFDIRKLQAEKKFDIWMYEYFYKNGEFPSNKESIEKYREFRNEIGI